MTSIRRGQLITTHGIGSIITDKDNENFLVLTTDTWVYQNRGKYIVDEPRLQNYLGVRTLIQPPPAEKKKGPNGKETVKEFIKAIRFPSGHFCPNNQCKTLQKVGYEEKVGGCSNPECNNRRTGLVPVRFLSVCENGHIDDFPFQEWVHGSQSHEGHILQYDEWAGKTGLGGINIKCKTCGREKSMQGALSPDSLKNVKSCTGLRPWLYKGRTGRQMEESCDKSLQGAQKAASNVYFPVITFLDTSPFKGCIF